MSTTLCKLEHKAEKTWKCSVCGNVFPYPCKAVCGAPQTLRAARAGIGPGDILKKTLERFGIAATPGGGCGCSDMSKLMNSSGWKWCEDNIEHIVDHLEKQAKSRGLPFLRVIGRRLVLSATRQSRKLHGE